MGTGSRNQIRSMPQTVPGTKCAFVCRLGYVAVRAHSGASAKKKAPLHIMAQNSTLRDGKGKTVDFGAHTGAHYMPVCPLTNTNTALADSHIEDIWRAIMLLKYSINC